VVYLARHHFSGPNPMLSSFIHIKAIDELLRQCIVAMVVRIYGSFVTQRITGGRLRIVERVLDGEHFSWGMMLHCRMMGKIHQCETTDSGDFSFESILVAWFLERVPLLRPRIMLAPVGP
jgi:hypothetical protein